jgi:hypothetical protein
MGSPTNTARHYTDVVPVYKACYFSIGVAVDILEVEIRMCEGEVAGGMRKSPPSPVKECVHSRHAVANGTIGLGNTLLECFQLRLQMVRGSRISFVLLYFAISIEVEVVLYDRWLCVHLVRVLVKVKAARLIELEIAEFCHCIRKAL